MKKIRIYPVKVLSFFNRALVCSGLLFALLSTNTSYSQCVNEESTAMNDSIGSGVNYLGQSFIANVSIIDTVGVWLWPYLGPNQIKFGIAPDDGAGNPDETAVLWMSGLITLPVAGQWVYFGGLGIAITPGLTYHVLIDTTGGGNYGLGYSTTDFTSTGENLKYSTDGGLTWTLFTSPLSIYISGDCTGGGGCTTTISAFPYNEDFEAEPLCVTTCSTACVLTGAWTNSLSDNIDWTVDEGGTPSTSTGPSVDNTTGSATGNYIYTESSGGCSPSQEAILIGPCFDLTVCSTPAINFYYHMFGTDMGTLNLDVEATPGSGIWTNLWTLAGDQGDVWTLANVSLIAFAGTTIQLRFRGVTGLSFRSDMAIDDINLDCSGCVSPTLSIVGNNPTTCGGSNGSATVTASGGTPPSYTYSWNTVPVQTTATATGLVAGTYIVTVTNSTCTTTTSVTLVGPTGTATLVMSGSDVSCFGGSDGIASVVATGGASPYTYSWSPSGGIGPTANGLSAGTYTVTVTEANGCDNTNSVTIFEPTAITTTFNTIDPNCGNNDGSITVNASGGGGGYSYQWNPAAGSQTTQTAINLVAGTYSVTITDANGCTVTATATLVDQAGTATLGMSSSVVSCYGGSDGTATVAVTGGATPYTYSWSPSGGADSTANGLSAGTYIVTVTEANGCINTDSVVVGEPTPITATFTSVDPSCGNNDGSLTVNAIGGGGGYTYLWDPAAGNQTTQMANGLFSGIYSVTVTDADNCNVVFSVNLSDIGAPTMSMTITNVTCKGDNNGAAWVNSISGGTMPYTYLWSTGAITDSISGLPGGTYTLTVTDSTGCKVIQDAVIFEPDLLTVSPNYMNTTDTMCDGQAIANATGGTFPYAYQWDDPLSQTTAIANNLCMGIYTVTVTDFNGCTTSGSVFVDSTVSGITNISTVNINFTVYPNPILNEATIAFELDKPSNVQLALYDMMGRRIELFRDKKENAGIHLQPINASELNITNGIYMVTLVVDGEIYYSKVAIFLR